MTNRSLGLIVREQNPLMLPPEDTLGHACQRMWKRRVGAVLVVDAQHRLVGIFTGRDAVRAIASGKAPETTPLAAAMTSNPDTIAPERTAVEALRAMRDGGYRHLPVVSEGKVLGCVSRGDFEGLELDRLEEETRLWERIC
jgi:CBS domain-containing protein